MRSSSPVITDPRIPRRQLGARGPKVGVIGFGGWAIGGRTAGESSYGETDDDMSRAAIRRAVDRGVTLFDTAPAYGDGRSERLLGEVLAPFRARVQIATKAGYASWTAAPDFSPAALDRSLDSSLERLRTGWVDVLWLHSPPTDLLLETPEIFAALDRMVADGRIGLWGISCKAPEDALRVLDRHRVPLLQVNLNMLDIRMVECGLAERAEAAGVGIVARTPLCFGFLTGTIGPGATFPDGDHRRAWPARQIDAWAAGAAATLAIAGAAPGAEACAAALRFCLSFPAVATVLPGAVRPGEVDEQVAAGVAGPLDRAIVDAIIAHNRAHSYFVRR
jgi:aryl-alcohol dehydrogenase-like predicted oxidoreductase